MSMLPLSQTKDIFQQLAGTDGSAGVQTLIETHDAWVHNLAVQGRITAAVRAQLARTLRPESVLRRIRAQAQRLDSLVIRLPERLSSAG